MKKLWIAGIVVLSAITACKNNKTPMVPNADSTRMIPIDTVKIDTMKTTDTVIKG